MTESKSSASPVKRHRTTHARNDLYFAIYHQIGASRSLEKLREQLFKSGLSVSMTTLQNYSAQNGWQKRLAILGVQGEAETNARLADTVVEMNERQASLGKAMQSVGAGALKVLLGRAGDLTATETGNLLAAGVKVERLARGESTSRHEITTQVINQFVVQIVAIFNEVNNITSPAERAERFATRADNMVADHQKQLGQSGGR